MIIGIDLDNTLIDYNLLFYNIALEYNLIPKKIEISKNSVKNYLVEKGMENDWIELQGVVYGSRLDEAKIYEGAYKFITWAHENGHSIKIVSHKTLYSFSKIKYNLHKAAYQWINLNILNFFDFGKDTIYFEVSKKNKIERISSLKVDYFIDDLPEILLDNKFPSLTQRILFDPDNIHKEFEFKRALNWNSIQQMIN